MSRQYKHIYEVKLMEPLSWKFICMNIDDYYLLRGVTMWDRKVLKERAKDVLRASYWKAFVVGLLLVLAGGGGGVSSYSSWNSGTESSEYGGYINGMLIVVALVVTAIFVGLALIFRIFVGGPLEAGALRYYKRAAEQDVEIGYVASAFQKGRYGDIVKTMIWRDVLNFLWFLLLVVPGIVKYYAYSQTAFILADNPNIGYNRAVELSTEMTQGHKLRLFVLDLSFLGWWLLGGLLFGIGTLFVVPYVYSTKAELYLVLRREALDNRLTSEQELRLTSIYK